MMRIHEELYRHLQLYPRRLLVPHRLLPYPTTVDTVVISVVMIVLIQEVLAIPTVLGRKSKREQFAGAEETWTIEALMQVIFHCSVK
jgi:hypothetical protein